MTFYQCITYVFLIGLSFNLDAQSDTTGLDVPLPIDTSSESYRLPTISLSVPDPVQQGYLGIIGGGLIFQSRTRITGEFFDPDGNASFSIGLGNPEKYLGLETRMNIYGLSSGLGAPGNFGEGTFDFHLSRALPNDIWVGAGGFNLFGWDLEPPNKLASYYLVTSKIFKLKEGNRAFSHMYVSLGMGNGRFRLDNDYTIFDEAPWNLFASVAVQVGKEMNFIAEWNGFNVFSGVSVLPFKKLPFQMIVGIDDIFHPNRKLIVAASCSLSVFKKSRMVSFPTAGFIKPPPPQTSRVF